MELEYEYTGRTGTHGAKLINAVYNGRIVGRYLGFYNGNTVELYRTEGTDEYCPRRASIAPEMLRRA